MQDISISQLLYIFLVNPLEMAPSKGSYFPPSTLDVVILASACVSGSHHERPRITSQGRLNHQIRIKTLLEISSDITSTYNWASNPRYSNPSLASHSLLQI